MLFSIISKPLYIQMFQFMLVLYKYYDKTGIKVAIIKYLCMSFDSSSWLAVFKELRIKSRINLRSNTKVIAISSICLLCLICFGIASCLRCCYSWNILHYKFLCCWILLCKFLDILKLQCLQDSYIQNKCCCVITANPRLTMWNQLILNWQGEKQCP